MTEVNAVIIREGILSKHLGTIFLLKRNVFHEKINGCNDAASY